MTVETYWLQLWWVLMGRTRSYEQTYGIERNRTRFWRNRSDDFCQFVFCSSQYRQKFVLACMSQELGGTNTLPKIWQFIVEFVTYFINLWFRFTSKPQFNSEIVIDLFPINISTNFEYIFGKFFNIHSFAMQYQNLIFVKEIILRDLKDILFTGLNLV